MARETDQRYQETLHLTMDHLKMESVFLENKKYHRISNNFARISNHKALLLLQPHDTKYLSDAILT